MGNISYGYSSFNFAPRVCHYVCCDLFVMIGGRKLIVDKSVSLSQFKNLTTMSRVDIDSLYLITVCTNVHLVVFQLALFGIYEPQAFSKSECFLISIPSSMITDGATDCLVLVVEYP